MLELLRQGLYEHGYTVMTAGDGCTALEIAAAHEFDAMVLDIGLPMLDGYGVMQRLRALERRPRVLMLTARDAEDEIIRGLDAGADDYLTKPFAFAELVARLQSITRPRREESSGLIAAGDVVVDPLRHTVTRRGASITLTPHEFQLLVCLVRGAGRCVSRQTLIKSIWDNGEQVCATALDVLVNSLRTKIDAPFDQKLVATVRGSGYLFRQAAGEPRRVTQ